MKTKAIRAKIRMQMLAAAVNPLRLLASLSRRRLLHVSWLTIDMFEIYTDAHPRLKIAGIIRYQAY